MREKVKSKRGKEKQQQQQKKITPSFLKGWRRHVHYYICSHFQNHQLLALSFVRAHAHPFLSYRLRPISSYTYYYYYSLYIAQVCLTIFLLFSLFCFDCSKKSPSSYLRVRTSTRMYNICLYLNRPKVSSLLQPPTFSRCFLCVDQKRSLFFSLLFTKTFFLLFIIVHSTLCFGVISQCITISASELSKSSRSRTSSSPSASSFILRFVPAGLFSRLFGVAINTKVSCNCVGGFFHSFPTQYYIGGLRAYKL